MKSGAKRSKVPHGGITEPKSSVVPSVAWAVGAVVATEDALVVASTGAASFAATGVDALVDSLPETVAEQAVWILAALINASARYSLRRVLFLEADRSTDTGVVP